MSSLSNSTLILLAIAALQACVPPPARRSSAGNSQYEEDLSVLRNTYPEPNYASWKEDAPDEKDKPLVQPAYDIRAEMDTVQARILRAREGIDSVDGLSIQVYSGSSREKASEAKRRVYALSADYSPSIAYEQPNYKVTVGRYFSRLEAYKDFKRLKQEFAEALLVPSKIPINAKD